MLSVLISSLVFHSTALRFHNQDKEENSSQDVESFHCLKDKTFTFSDAYKNCAFETQSLEASGTFPLALYFSDPESILAGTGIDLIPELSAENRVSYPTRIERFPNISNCPSDGIQGPLKFRSCDIKRGAGKMHIQETGPFITTGGYSWVFLHMQNIFIPSKEFDGRSQGVSVVEISVQLVDEWGTPFDFPPLHNHHTQVSKGLPPFAADPFRCAVLKEAAHCYSVDDKLMLFTQDDICTAADGGLDCLNKAAPSGSGWVWKKSASAHAAFNDVRVGGSSPLKWYVQYVVRWVPREKGLVPLSLIDFFTSWSFQDVARAKRINPVITVPLDKESFTWSTNTYGYNGNIVGGRYHNHGVNVDTAWLFHARPSDLGLDTSQFNIRPAWEVILPQEVGMTSNSHLQRYVLEKAGSSHPNPMRCQSYADDVQIGGFDYSRRARSCCKAWEFRETDIWTSITFYSMKPDYRMLHEPNVKQKFSYQHTSFNLQFQSYDNETHYALIWGSHDPRIRGHRQTSEDMVMEQIAAQWGGPTFVTFIPGYMQMLMYWKFIFNMTAAKMCSDPHFFIQIFVDGMKEHRGYVLLIMIFLLFLAVNKERRSIIKQS